MEKNWRILHPDRHLVEKLTRDLKCTPTFAKILVNRNITSASQALNFLHPSLKHMRPPFDIKDMDTAVQRIGNAIRHGEKILIFGDYDVDGITSAVVIFEFLQEVGANISMYFPHRLKEGYGLKEQHIQDYVIPNNIDLVITTDCGSSSHGAVKKAQNAGSEVIITDHHRVSPRLPPATALINPNRPDCSAGFEHLSGVGVAFMLTVCLRKYLRDIDFWPSQVEPNLLRLCDLVALGTVADAVSLVAENRVLTYAGINLIKTGNTRPGLKTLLDASSVPAARLTAEDIAYRIAPRLNAAGRLGHAEAAANLLTTKDPAAAEKITRYLEELNSARKQTEIEILTDIRHYLTENPRELQKSALVLAQPDWHEGVLGIVASRLVEQYYRPVVLLSVQDGYGKGSARSVPGFDVFRGLSACRDLLEAFGGHAMAGGLKIKDNNIEPFKRCFEAVAKETIGSDQTVPEILLDGELQLSEISEQLLDEIETLRPFGADNPSPLFMARNVTVKASQIVGQRHRRMSLSQPSGGIPTTVSAIHFNSVTDTKQPQSFDRIAFRLNWNYWNGIKKIQLIIEETGGQDHPFES